MESSAREALWSSGGTAAGTCQLQAFPGRIAWLTGAGKAAVFFVRPVENSAPIELWRVDGKAATLITKLWPAEKFDIASPGQPLDARPVFANGKLFFPGWDASGLQELWMLEGGTAHPIADLRPPGQIHGDLRSLVALNSLVCFKAPGAGLYRTDGTEGGTRRLLAWNLMGAPVVTGNQMLLLAALPNKPERGLLRWESLEAGSETLLEQNRATGPWQPQDFCLAGDKLFFGASDSSHGLELWTMQGKGQATLVKETAPGREDGYFQMLGSYRGRVFFVGRNPKGGRAVWSSDGSEGGTQMLSGMGRQNTVGLFEVCNGQLYLSLELEEYRGVFLTVSDGTPAGTKKVEGMDDWNQLRGCQAAGKLFVFASNDRETQVFCVGK